MMNSTIILKSDLLDIIFDGRNKAYGAYELRRTYNRRIAIALLGMLTLVASVLIVRAISVKTKDAGIQIAMIVNETMLQDLQQPEEPVLPQLPAPPPAPVATIQYTNPAIVKDDEVVSPPPAMADLEQARIDIKTQEGIKEDGVIAPPAEEPGTGVVAAPVVKKNDEDEIFMIVEKDARFPGGPDAWQRYVTREVQKELDEFTESDFGTVTIRFLVDKTGAVSDVQAMNMKGSKLAEIAVNAIRKGPRWIPALQNGTYVKAYRLQPVTLKNPNL